MNNPLTVNPILNFRNLSKGYISLNPSMGTSGHNGIPDGKMNCMDDTILKIATLITETREAVDSSEHSY